MSSALREGVFREGQGVQIQTAASLGVASWLTEKDRVDTRSAVELLFAVTCIAVIAKETGLLEMDSREGESEAERWLGASPNLSMIAA